MLDTVKPLLEHPEAQRLGWNIRADDLRLKLRGFNLPEQTLTFDGMKAVAFLDSRHGKGLETGIKYFTIIDLATLTGAIMVSLGTEMAGLFTNSTDLEKQIIAAGRGAGTRSAAGAPARRRPPGTRAAP